MTQQYYCISNTYNVLKKFIDIYSEYLESVENPDMLTSIPYESMWKIEDKLNDELDIEDADYCNLLIANLDHSANVLNDYISAYKYGDILQYKLYCFVYNTKNKIMYYHKMYKPHTMNIMISGI